MVWEIYWIKALWSVGVMEKGNFLKENRQICVMFIIAVIVYGVIASMFTSTVHVGVDEELYVALAKSFHYKGRFEVDGGIVNYNCVLYSMLISLVYYIYSPERILFLMRMIGIISMCSAVFPIYFLSKRVFEDDRKAIAFSGMTLLVPYMFDGMYLMQEVLSYPLFLWTIYFLYVAYEKMNITKGNRWLVLSAVFSVLCFFTKTYLFFVPVVVNCCYFLSMGGGDTKERKRLLRKLLMYDMTYLMCTVCLYLLVRSINGGVEGSNHYATQFSVLFPISAWTFVSGAICYIVYFSLLFLNIGIFPFGALIFNKNKLTGADKWLRSFCLIAGITLVLEIVFLIVLTEEGVPTIPHKFLFRYFQVLFPPVFMIFCKDIEEEKYLKNRIVWLLFGVCFGVCLCYFVSMQGKTRQAIMDGYLYLTVENAAKYGVPYVDAAVVVLAGATTAFCIRLICKGRTGVVKKVLCVGTIGVILFWILNCVQLSVYTNLVADGKTIESDSIKIAHYLNETDGNLYYLTVSKEDTVSYLRNFYGYVRQSYQVISLEELEQILNEKEERGNIFVLVPSGQLMEVEGMEWIDLHTERLSLYTLSNS